jgi:hypothetical protein
VVATVKQAGIVDGLAEADGRAPASYGLMCMSWAMGPRLDWQRAGLAAAVLLGGDGVD